MMVVAFYTNIKRLNGAYFTGDDSLRILYCNKSGSSVSCNEIRVFFKLLSILLFKFLVH